MTDTNRPVELYEVGSYGDLSGRPNPDGYVVLLVPEFDAMIQIIERDLRRELLASEIAARREEAPAIVLLKDEAAKMLAERS